MLIKKLAKWTGIGQIRFSGPYSDWSAAEHNASGYDDHAILQKVKMALQEVKAGRAACERDSVLFDSPQYSYPALSGLLMAAAESGELFRVLDYGGSLGSSYFLYRDLLSTIKTLHWCVVEQAHFVSCGTADFADEKLSFHSSIGDACGLMGENPSVIFCSSVLQYLSQPVDAIEQIKQAKPQYVIVDRTPFGSFSQHTALVQHVPATLYKASYPFWSFNYDQFLRAWTDQFECLIEFEGNDGTIGHGKLRAKYRGMVLRRKEAT